MKIPVAILVFSSLLVAGCATPYRKSSQCDYSKPETAPASRFQTDLADGTAFDTRTRLTWRICAEGQSYADEHCSGKASLYPWDKAVHLFGDRSDGWRLPNADELNSITEKRCRNPSINMTVFPDAPASDFWSATSYAPDTAMYVDFDDSSSAALNKKYNNQVRLVRGNEWFSPAKEAQRERMEMADRQKDEAELAADKRRRDEEFALVQDEKDDYVTCYDPTSCDRMFALTRQYILSTATQNIQTVTDTTIETSSPDQDGKIAMSAIRIPGAGSSEVIHLTVSCRVDDKGVYDKLCEKKQLGIYRNFRPFINRMLDH